MKLTTQPRTGLRAQQQETKWSRKLVTAVRAQGAEVPAGKQLKLFLAVWTHQQGRPVLESGALAHRHRQQRPAAAIGSAYTQQRVSGRTVLSKTFSHISRHVGGAAAAAAARSHSRGSLLSAHTLLSLSCSLCVFLCMSITASVLSHYLPHTTHTTPHHTIRPEQVQQPHHAAQEPGCLTGYALRNR